MKAAAYRCWFVCISRSNSCLKNFHSAKRVWCPWSSCPPFLRKEFLLFSVSHTLRPSSHTLHQHKCRIKHVTTQRIFFLVVGVLLGKSIHLLSKLVFLLVNSEVGAMPSKLMDSPWGLKSFVYPLAWRADTGNISHTSLLACLSAFSERQEDEVHPSLATVFIQTVLFFIPAPGCFSVVHDKLPFSLRILGCIFFCFLTLTAIPPCNKLSKSIWSSINVNLGSWHLGRNDGKFSTLDLIQHFSWFGAVKVKSWSPRSNNIPIYSGSSLSTLSTKGITILITVIQEWIYTFNTWGR